MCEGERKGREERGMEGRVEERELWRERECREKNKGKGKGWKEG